MRIFSDKTALEIIASIAVNLTSGWLGILLIAPGIFGVSGMTEYFRLVVVNLPFGVLGFIASGWLLEKSKLT
jgi:hypothetical protein